MVKKSVEFSYPTPVPIWVIGTYDALGKPDAMTAAWVGIVNSEPPVICVGIRPSRYTYENIKNKRCFSVNIPSKDYADEADYFGIESGKDVDKFKKAGLTAKKCFSISAPYIEEFPMHIECQLKDRVNLGSHIVVFGKIVGSYTDEDKTTQEGKPDIEKIIPILYDPGTKSYYTSGQHIGKGFVRGLKIKKEQHQNEII